MATCSVRSLRVSGFPVGLLVFAFCPLSAQKATISVSSRVTEACGSSVVASAAQRQLEASLRDAAFQIAKVNAASVGSEVDCVAVPAHGKSRTTAIHQCLALSQVVSLPAQARSA